MDSDNKNKFHCDEDDGEYRFYCQICDNFSIDRY